MGKHPETLDNIIQYYRESFSEDNRLKTNWGELEYVRSKDIIKRYLPKPPATILDIGGGSGIYSLWLARKGYEVHLIDPVPLHIKQAIEYSNNQPDSPIASCTIGDARNLKSLNSSADSILLMGPLYHLQHREDRLKVIKECYRVLKKEGFLFAVIISKFASIIDGFCEGYFKDPEFRKIMLQDLENGQHKNPTNNPMYFTDAYFQHPAEFKDEIEEAGFIVENVISIECFSYNLRDFDEVWKNLEERNFLLKILRIIENDSSLIGASPHIMCVAKKNSN
ncbi:MAG: class I SAM-dependent methyltransferase [Promethearchaeota archaeon]